MSLTFTTGVKIKFRIACLIGLLLRYALTFYCNIVANRRITELFHICVNASLHFTYSIKQCDLR